MRLEELLEEIKKIDPDKVRLFFMIRKKRSDKIEYDLLSSEITSEISKKFIEITNTVVSQLLDMGKLQYKEYKPAIYYGDNTIETIEIGEIQDLEETLNRMTFLGLKEFNTSVTKNLWAYAIKISNPDIILFRKYTESRILEKKGLIPLIWSDGRFNQIDGSVLTIDEDIDCIIFNKQIYILNKLNFEKIFSFMDKFKDKIKTQISILETKEILDDINKFLELCSSDARKIKKLYKLLESDTLTNIDFQKIKEINDNYNLNLNFTEDNKIIIEKEKLWDILRVLDDDYLKSPITDNKYLAHSKEMK